MIRSALAGLLALFVASAALAQTFPTVPAQSVIGRMGVPGDTGPSQAIPFATLSTLIGGGGYTIAAGFNGFACNGTTDDTAALNALLVRVNAAGGGTITLRGRCLISGQVNLPNNGGSAFTQAPIRITGLSNINGPFGPLLAAPSALDMRYNAPIAKILTLGAGRLEVDHINLIDGGTDCAAFIKTTNTSLYFHDNTFSGTAANASACNDVFIFGGAGIIGNTNDSAFQGYGTIIDGNAFNNIRKGAIFNGAANGIIFKNNTVSLTSGNGATKAITAASNANPAVLTSTAHGFAVGDKIRMNISGATGNWTPINGAAVTVTIIGANTFSVPVDSTGFGALTGSPVFPDGVFLDFVGSTNYTTEGNLISGNLVEMAYYAYFARMTNGSQNQFNLNNLFDATPGATIAFYKALAAYNGSGLIANGYNDAATPGIVGAGATCTNPLTAPTFLNPTPSNSTYGIFTCWPSDTTFSGTATLIHPLVYNPAGTTQLIVRNGSSQSGDLLQVQDGSNVKQVWVDSAFGLRSNGEIFSGGGYGSTAGNDNIIYSPASHDVILAPAGTPQFEVGPNVGGAGANVRLSSYGVGILKTDVSGNIAATPYPTIGSVAFASLPTPALGMVAVVTDSNTNTWGATIAAGGANKVLAFYNGTNWTVAGK